MLAAKHVLHYLKGSLKLGIRYGCPATPLIGFSDADQSGDINTQRFTTGYVIMLNNGAVA